MNEPFDLISALHERGLLVVTRIFSLSGDEFFIRDTLCLVSESWREMIVNDNLLWNPVLDHHRKTDILYASVNKKVMKLDAVANKQNNNLAPENSDDDDDNNDNEIGNRSDTQSFNTHWTTISQMTSLKTSWLGLHWRQSAIDHDSGLHFLLHDEVNDLVFAGDMTLKLFCFDILDGSLSAALSQWDGRRVRALVRNWDMKKTVCWNGFLFCPTRQNEIVILRVQVKDASRKSRTTRSNRPTKVVDLVVASRMTAFVGADQLLFDVNYLHERSRIEALVKSGGITKKLHFGSSAKDVAATSTAQDVATSSKGNSGKSGTNPSEKKSGLSAPSSGSGLIAVLCGRSLADISGVQLELETFSISIQNGGALDIVPLNSITVDKEAFCLSRPVIYLKQEIIMVAFAASTEKTGHIVRFFTPFCELKHGTYNMANSWQPMLIASGYFGMVKRSSGDAAFYPHWWRETLTVDVSSYFQLPGPIEQAIAHPFLPVILTVEAPHRLSVLVLEELDRFDESRVCSEDLSVPSSLQIETIFDFGFLAKIDDGISTKILLYWFV